jgi:flagellar biogenesis protein FliO
VKSIEAVLADAVATVSPRAGETLRRAVVLVRGKRSAGPSASVGSRPAGGRSRRMLLVNGSLMAGVLVIGVLRLLPPSQPAGPALFASPAPSALPAASSATTEAAAQPVASAAPALSPSGSTAVTSPTAGIDPIDLILKTVLVAGLVVLGLRFLKRIQNGKPGSGDGIVILETRPLAPKATLYVVGVRGRQLVVGLTPAGLTTLTEFAEPAAPTAQPANGVAAALDAGRPLAVPAGTRAASMAPALEKAFLTASTAATLKPEQSTTAADAPRTSVPAPTFGAAFEEALRAAPRASRRRMGTGRRGTVVALATTGTPPSISVIGRANAELESTARRNTAARRAQSA